ncbi:MAG: TRAP transporter TatT component family protein [Bacteroidota bacterium]|nr:TRAP transporter TatT component family protein [Bacteroidota bacterium]
MNIKILSLTAFILFSISFSPVIANQKNETSKSKAIELFNQRQEKSKLEESIVLMQEILSKEKDYELSVLLSRAYYFLAEHAENNTQRLELYDKGVKAGEVALNQVESYTQSFNTSKKEEEAVKAVTIANIDALYWTAANLARWAKFASFTKKVASKARVRYLWDRVNELDPNYFYGGSYRFFGGYFALVPTITGDQDPVKSKEMFEKCIAAAPEYLETKILYAEAYCTHAKIKDIELFRKLLNDVISADLSAHPAIYAENLIAKGKAEKLLKDEKNLFE